MKKLLALCFPLLCLLMPVFAARAAPPAFPVPFEDKASGLWGYADAKNGREVLPACYIVAEAFNKWGRAFVLADAGWFYIDTHGARLVRPFLFDNGPDFFQEGLARFVAKGKMGFFNRKGEIVIPAQYDFCEPFADGLAAVCRGCRKQYDGEHYSMVGGDWGCLDVAGRIVRPLRSKNSGCLR